MTDALEKVPQKPNLAFAIVCRPRLNAVLVEVLVGILLHVRLPQEIARHIRRVVRAIRASIKVSSSTRAHSALYHRPYKPPLRQRGLPLLINIEARGRRLSAMNPHAAAHHLLHPILLCLVIRIRQELLGVVLDIPLLWSGRRGSPFARPASRTLSSTFARAASPRRARMLAAADPIC